MKLNRIGLALLEELGGLTLRSWLFVSLTAWLPPPTFARARARLVRWAGVPVGKGTIIGGRLHLTGDPRLLRIGSKCFLNTGVHIDLSAAVSIGDGVALAQDVLVLTNTHEIGGPTHRAGVLRDAPVAIGNGCWVGARAVILPGVTVGAGSIVAAGAVVTNDVPPDSLVGGVPARVIRSLGGAPQPRPARARAAVAP